MKLKNASTDLESIIANKVIAVETSLTTRKRFHFVDQRHQLLAKLYI